MVSGDAGKAPVGISSLDCSFSLNSRSKVKVVPGGLPLVPWYMIVNVHTTVLDAESRGR